MHVLRGQAENTASNRIMTLMRKHAQAMSAAEEKHKAEIEVLRKMDQHGSDKQ